MTFTHYQKTGDKVFPVCPIDKPAESDYYRRHSDGLNRGDYMNQQRKAFETWLSTQPTITADPSIKDGLYKVDELEIVWQFRLRGFDTKWQNVDNQVYGRNTFHTYSDYCDTMGAFCRQYATLKQPVKQEEKPVRAYTEEHLKSLPFHDKYFSNETWHPNESDIADMGKDCYDEAISEWQQLEDVVLFDGFRVHFESCDCGDGYGCNHGSYPYDLVHPFIDTDMCWEDDGFYIESPKGLIRFDKTADITMYHFVKACELLDLPLTFK